jgi:hypothetical protein
MKPTVGILNISDHFLIPQISIQDICVLNADWSLVGLPPSFLSGEC